MNRSGARTAFKKRIQRFKDEDPTAANLDQWSILLGMGAVPLMIAWIYFGLETFHVSNMWVLVGGAVAFTIPSLVLSAAFSIRHYRYLRAKQPKSAS
jgi:hypothetical protein